jgi:hypothetical protein
MVSSGALTDAQLQKKASAIETSADGVEYLAARKKQLEDYYFEPNDIVKDGQIGEFKPKSNEDILAELIPDVVNGLKDIARNKSDENYGDLVRIVLNKLLKDMDTKNAAQPPQRYLPETSNNCRYRIFCEKECEDECLICKYRDFANKQGIFYDYKNQLDKRLVDSK